MKEIYYLHNNKLNIPLSIFLKEKEKYSKYSKNSYNEKRYLFNNFEGLIKETGCKSCFNKELINWVNEKDRLSIEWELKDIEWSHDITWQETEEYLCDEFKTPEYIIYFITTKNGFRRILMKK